MVPRDAARIEPFPEPPALTRYDVVLLAIPLSFLLGVVSALGLGHAPTVGVRVGAVLTIVPTAYALFGISPTDEPPRTRSTR